MTPWFARRICLFAALAVVATASPRLVAQSPLPVIPGGQGFGMFTRAAYGCGSNPSVLRVTNLNDSGTGSLREALLAAGPRVVIFELSGTISLSNDIIVTTPCATIAGQTAPSPGITIKGFGVQVYTHDVLMQHLRIRPGDGPPLQAQTMGHDGSIMYSDAYNVVFDHNSFSWAQGKNTEAGSLPTGAQVTYWRNITSEALYHAANVIIDAGQPSSLGLLLFQSYVQVPAYFSIIGNLFAHNSDRNPEIQGPVNAHIINNVIYDWGKDTTDYHWATFMYGDGSGNPMKVDIIGNKYIAGPAAGTPFTPLVAIGTYNTPAGTQVYIDDNAIDQSKQAVTAVVHHNGDVSVGSPPVSLSGITVLPSSGIEASVLTNAGARPADRDSVDRRIVSEVQNRTGQVISSQSQVGGWPTLTVNVRALSLPANPHTATASGYTNLELWLQGYAATVEGTTVEPTPPDMPLALRIVP
jgi:hypothetical protein